MTEWDRVTDLLLQMLDDAERLSQDDVVLKA